MEHRNNYCPLVKCDLERDLYSYGRLIYVESREQPSGKPKLWYQVDSQGHKHRFERKPFSIDTKRLDPGAYLDQ